MSSIDSRIVTMKFDNAQFENGASTTMSTLAKLKNALNLDGAAKGLNQVQDAANKTNLAPLQAGVNKVSAGFLALSTVAVTALATITHAAITTGAQVIKAFTLQPVLEGFKEYELKMGSIQTIMAGSGESLKTVNKTLQELNEYSDLTIYSFKDMTTNIGKFTNAGISLKDSTAAIKGVANAAALSGANSNEASRAMYNFAQALSSGVVRLQDWKSIELANMATKEFKQQLIDSAVAAGTLTKGADGMYTVVANNKVALNATKNFNASLTEEWLTTEALTGTLLRYADTTTDIGKRATAAATDVKTFSMMMDTLKESAGSGWATTSEIIFGDFEEAKKLWTGLNDVISGILNGMADRRNKMLTQWKNLGGRDTFIDGLRKAFEALQSVLKPITKAFREVFPATTGKQLYELTVKFKEFASGLKIGGETAIKLRHTFEGVFSIFSIAQKIIGGVIGVFADLFGQVGKSSGGFLTITAEIGKFITNIEHTLTEGGKLNKFFDELSQILQTPIKLLQALASYIFAVFQGFNKSDGDAVNGVFDRMADRLGPLAQLFQAVENALGLLSEKFKQAMIVMQPYIDAVQKAFAAVGQAIKDLFSGADINTVLDMVNTGLFAGLVVAIRKFLKNFKLDFGGGVIETIKDSFGALTGTLKAMEQNVKADTMMKIAGAVAILTASIAALAMIDSKKLVKASIAIATAFGQLTIAMAVLTKVGGMTGFLKIPIITAGMVMLAGAVVILAQAVKTLSKLSWEGIAKGLTGVGGSMIALVAAMKPLSKATGSILFSGIGLLAMATALRIMANAITAFARLPMKVIAHGLVAITGTLIILSGTMGMMPKNLPYTGLALIAVGIGVKLLASAIHDMSKLNLAKMIVGMAGLAVALAVMSMSLSKMPPTVLFAAASIVAVSFALLAISKAIKQMSTMSWDKVGVGLGTLAGALTILAVAMHFMSGAIFGAIALGILAASIALLVPALKTLGNLSLKEIATALGTLVGVFIILGVAGAAINAASVFVLALAGSMALLGAAVALTGLGILAFAKGLEILVKLGSAAGEAIALVIGSVIAAIPGLFQGFAEGIVNFTKTMAANIPTFVNATIKLIGGITKAINETAPKIAETMGKLLDLMLDYIIKHSPKITQAGFKLITEFMDKIRDNIDQIIDISAEIMQKFIKGIGDKAPKLIDEGVKTIIKLINGMADSIRTNSAAMNAAGKNLASAIITGFIAGISGGFSGVVNSIINMAKAALNAAKKFLGIASPSKEFEAVGIFVGAGLAVGIDKSASTVMASLDTLSLSMVDRVKKVARDVDDLTLLPGLEDPENTTIKPVIDLTAAEEAAKKLKEMLAIPGLFITGSMPPPNNFGDYSYQQASTIADGTNILNPKYKPPTTPNAEKPHVTFQQNNYSPKALSEIEIYRQTKNQLALAKGALE